MNDEEVSAKLGELPKRRNSDNSSSAMYLVLKRSVIHTFKLHDATNTTGCIPISYKLSFLVALNS